MDELWCSSYILQGKQPIPCPDQRRWGEWFNAANRQVAFTQVGHEVDVSTVFLGVDHNYHPDHGPVLFETMVFGGNLDQLQQRYSTWEEAEAGHQAIVALVSVVK